MKILYITTFNKKIYLASGNKMIKSFEKTQKNREILCCYEELSPKFYNKDFVKEFNLSKSSFMNSWLKENSDVIPPIYGGKAHQDKNPEVFLQWNYRAAGWFRKIATFEYLLNSKEKYDVVIFVDSDSQFKNYISDDLINEAFKDADCFYHWGKERKKKNLAVESGFIGFKNNDNGKELINKWIDKYRNKDFRRYLRWDDGGMFSNILIENNFKNSIDLVTDYADKERSQSHVVERGIFKDYIVHNKGLHKKIGLI